MEVEKQLDIVVTQSFCLVEGMVLFEHYILFDEAKDFGEQHVGITLISFVVLMIKLMEVWKKMLLIVTCAPVVVVVQ